jgi:hydroxyacylglutathione hydrolase
MWASLSKLTPLAGDTLVYCAHEYTAGNARFAAHVDAGNADLQRMRADIEAKRARGEPTVPSLLADELKCNPFLRPGGFWQQWGRAPLPAVALGMQSRYFCLLRCP